MLPRLAVVLLAATTLRGCLTYEYEHEFWLRVDGSGTVNVTGRPALWTAFKGLGRPEDPDGTATKQAVQELFERSGLRVKRVTLTRRRGQPYLFISADFDDVKRLSYSPAFPDLRVALWREGGRLRLEGSWQRPLEAPDIGARDHEGLMAVRFTFRARSTATATRRMGSSAATSSVGARGSPPVSTAAASSSEPRWTSGASSSRR